MRAPSGSVPDLWIVSAALAAVAACARPAPPELRIGINPWPGYEVLSLAADHGFYRAEGLDARLVEFHSLADERRAYERGQIDVMGTTVIEVLQARDVPSRAPQIIQVVDYSNGADVVLAQPGYARLAELRGARIGVELASLGVYVLARALAQEGLQLTDVVLVSTDQLSMEAEFRRGELAAIVTYPPTSVKLARDGYGRAVFSSRELPREVVDVLAVERDICRDRPADVARLLRGYQRGLAYIAAHPADAYREMAAREGLTADELVASLRDGIVLVPPRDQASYLGPAGSLPAVLTAVDRVLRATHQVQGPPRLADVVTDAFVEVHAP